MSHKHIGGQAVIEGVMMMNMDMFSIATIRDGKIKVKKEKKNSITKRHKWLAWPFFRGIISLYEMLVIGFKALHYSQNEAFDEDEPLTKKELIITILFAIALTVGLFIVLPLFLTGLVSKGQGFIFNAIDGVFRIAIFIIYLSAISLMKDVRRVFEYHGAEHKAVNCYESGKELTVKNCQTFSTVHRRCGTTFIMIVLVLSIIIFSLVPAPLWYHKLLTRIFFMPVIAGLSYELLKLGAKYEKNIFLKAMTYPGLLIQKLTTREPDDTQVKVAIAALKKVL